MKSNINPTYDDVTPPASLPIDNRVPEKAVIIESLTDPKRYDQLFYSFQTLYLTLQHYQQDIALCTQIINMLTRHKKIYDRLISSGDNIAAIALVDNNHYGEDVLRVILDDPEHEFRRVVKTLELPLLKEKFPTHACIFSQQRALDAQRVAMAICNVRNHQDNGLSLSDDEAYRISLLQNKT